MPLIRLHQVRAVARTALLVAALAQGWVFRHSVTPDGVSYLDLSDAVVGGRFGDLVNAYWSPLYPALIGIVRALLSATPLASPYWEFTILHGVNVAAFVLSLAAFEWFLKAIDDSSVAWGTAYRPFATPLGLASAYVLFGVAALSMISVEGSVPDLLLCAALFGAFACLLRLRIQGRASAIRTAVLLGVLLALGALTKSFVFPLAIVVLVTLAIANWAHDRGRTALIAAAVFALCCAPWVYVLSRSLGHFSTGRTGALNYAWYVNHQQPPNTGVMPELANPHSLPLDGVGILSPAHGTNPLWLEPAYWHRNLRPDFSIQQQWVRMRPNLLYYLAILAPVLFSMVVIGLAAEWRDLRATFARSAVVLLPSIAAFGAYAMVYATSRYVAPFLVASLLTLAAAFPGAARLRAARMALAAGLSLVLIDVLSPLRGRVFLSYALAAFLASWLAWRAARGPRFRWALVLVTTIVLLALVSQLPRLVVLSATAAVGIGLWIMLSSVGDEPDAIASEVAVRRAFAIAAIAALALPSALASWHAARRWNESANGVTHPEWSTAQRMIGDGIPRGSRIAVVGNPERSGWARLNRYRIVAVVPEQLADRYSMLSDADRETLWRAFAAAGATRIVTRNGGAKGP